MSYNTGTLSGGANPAKELMDTVQTLIDAHPAWVFVEQVAGTVTTTKRVDVFKCLGSANALGSDFYAAISRSADNGNGQVLIAEQYDGSTKKFTNGLTYSSSAVAVNSDGTHANSTAKHVADASTNSVSTPGFLSGPSSPTTGNNPNGVAITSSTPWFLSVTADCIVLSCGTFQVYLGAFDSAYSSGVDPWPIGAFSLHPMSSLVNGYLPAFGTVIPASGGFTRDLGGASGSMLFPGAGAIDKGLIENVSTGTTSVQKDPVTGLWNAGRVGLCSNTRRGVRRGILKSHVLAIPMAEVSEGVGDTITIDGVVYTCFLVPNTSTFSVNYIESIWVSQAA